MRKSLRIQTVFCTNFFFFCTNLEKNIENFLSEPLDLNLVIKAVFFFFTPQRLLFFYGCEGREG